MDTMSCLYHVRVPNNGWRHTMTRPERRSVDRDRHPSNRYGQLTTAEGVVVYDRDETSGWLQSDVHVALTDLL